MHGASGKRHRVVVVLLSPRVALLHLLAGKDEQDLGRKSRGGRCRRGLIEGVFLSKSGTCSPPAPCTVALFMCGKNACFWSVILECLLGQKCATESDKNSKVFRFWRQKGATESEQISKHFVLGQKCATES